MFNDFLDFCDSISTEEQNWETFFPLGVNLLFVNVDDDSNLRMEKFVFEPASSQFLFASTDDRDFYLLLNTASTASFLLFQDADKPVKPPIGYVYEIVIDDDGDGVRDPGETTYVGSSTRIERRFRDHETLDDMIDDPNHKIKI